ncbi:HIRAN domain-containing protein [Cardiobacteriaceae bacterium TAE3-ERU3]|nr:HIRAN domain-containing protein [Cardiobacteriaceae bacterium TAE3-ERU3]
MLSFLRKFFRPAPQPIVERVPIAGLQYYRANDLVQFMDRGDTLDLVQEPGNPHDPNAIMVEWRHNKIGYIPSEEAKNVRKLLKRHKCICAKITEIDPAANERRWVKLNIYPCSAANFKENI